MSQALYRKWRPARFDDVVGQEHVTRTLQNSLIAERVSHAFLFSGPRGTGKTTTARLLAKAVNCKHETPAQRPDDTCSICKAISDGRFLDLIEIDAASNTSVDNIRDLRDKINFAPTEGRFKVYIIDEVHMLSIAAFNALLKTLEEPPPHAKFVLATTELHKVPITIQSRCQLFQFRLLSTKEIVGRLAWLAEQEQLTIEPSALQLIAQQGAGSLRDAESLLDQLVTVPGDEITLERTQKVLGTAPIEAMYQLTKALLTNEAAKGLSIIHETLSAGTDTRQFARQMVSYLRGILLLQTAGETVTLELPADQQAPALQLAQQATRPILIKAIKQFSEAATIAGNSWQPQLPLELAFIESLTQPPNPETHPPAKKVDDRQQTTVAQSAITRTQTTTRSPSSPAPKPQPPKPKIENVDKQEPATPKPEMVSPQSTHLTIDQVTQHWHTLVNTMRQQDRNLSALMSACQPLATEGNNLILGFQFPVLKEKFDSNPKAGRLVANILSELIGQTCIVRTMLNEHFQQTSSNISEEAFQALANQMGGIVQKES